MAATVDFLGWELAFDQLAAAALQLLPIWIFGAIVGLLVCAPLRPVRACPA